MATHCSILAQKIPWTEEPGSRQFMGLQRVGHDWATNEQTEKQDFGCGWIQGGQKNCFHEYGHCALTVIMTLTLLGPVSLLGMAESSAFIISFDLHNNSPSLTPFMDENLGHRWAEVTPPETYSWKMPEPGCEPGGLAFNCSPAVQEREHTASSSALAPSQTLQQLLLLIGTLVVAVCGPSSFISHCCVAFEV